ncbi:MAG: chorismate lyase [Endomicrobia bacterium]|nr:chorismate lyase [Endomicrobiia bacterium]
MAALNLFDKINKLEKSFGKLSGVQKILLSTDGSVTDILDVLYGKTQICVLEQKIIKADNKTAKFFKINKNAEINYRVILIHKDNLPLILAESYAPLKRLDKNLKKELNASQTPIGRILQKQNMETRREILSMGIERGNSAKELFKNTGPLLGRTYKIISGGEILIRIKEIFSQHIL